MKRINAGEAMSPKLVADVSAELYGPAPSEAQVEARDVVVKDYLRVHGE